MLVRKRKEGKYDCWNDEKGITDIRGRLFYAFSSAYLWFFMMLVQKLAFSSIYGRSWCTK